MLNRNVLHGAANSNVVWVRGAHMAGFREKRILCIVRPGDRTDSSKPGGNAIGAPIALRFIKRTGDPLTGRTPEFYDDDGTTVILTECFAKKIGELTAQDLSGASPDYATPGLVAIHLALVYDTPRLFDEDVVTVTRLRYIDRVASDEEWAQMVR